MPRFVLALDLQEDPTLIAEYEAYHRAVWPEIERSITDAGITALEIFRVENRLVMIIEATEAFSFEAKAAADAANAKVQEWEQLMWKYQRAVPGGAPGEKWRLMTRIY